MTILHENNRLRIEINEKEVITMTDKSTGVVLEISPSPWGIILDTKGGRIKESEFDHQLYHLSPHS